jgi:hypothetical protein
MPTHIGEYVVGAYLKLKLDCDFVDYHVRPPGGGLEGLQELDVVGLNLRNGIAYLCEVTTHIGGVFYGDNRATVEKIKQKHERQQAYAAKYLPQFNEVHYMFWAPVVPVGYITENLAKVESLELVINGEYKRCVEELRELARATTHDTGNPFFRMLQILEHMRDWTTGS